jgi:threonine dehydratase
MIPQEWLQDAAERITPYIQETPLTHDPEYDFYLKWENHQVTGSFKARGAFNKVLVLESWERDKGLLAASAGNHGQGVALAGKQFGAPVTIYASDKAVPAKIEAMRSLGADVILISGGYEEAEKSALAHAKESDATWISPYNDGQIIAGQGTIGLEVIQQLKAYPDFKMQNSTWVVPSGGGGLLSGVGAALIGLSEHPKLVGVQAENSAFTHAIFHTGSQDGITEHPTIADGLAGPVEAGSITIPMIQQYADDFVLVNEDEIKAAIAFAWIRYGERIEGSAAAALAAALTGKAIKPAVIVITGGNIQPKVHSQLIADPNTR